MKKKTSDYYPGDLVRVNPVVGGEVFCYANNRFIKALPRRMICTIVSASDKAAFYVTVVINEGIVQIRETNVQLLYSFIHKR